MGTCSYCGSRFPLTRSTRKYCTPRCKTNACLDRNPSRMRAADVRALYELLEEESVPTVEALRERLRRIIARERPAMEVEVEPLEVKASDEPYVPRMD